MTATVGRQETDGSARLGWVARPRLTDRLAATRAPIVALVAPAGYGKTTLLAQWAATDARSAIWTDLAALKPEDADAPVIVVLDDVQPGAQDDFAWRLTTLAHGLPPGSVVAITARGELGLPVGRMRLEGTLDDFGALDLAMTGEEVSRALRQHGVCVEDAQLSRVMSLTEGWPAAVVLAARALGAHGMDD